MVNTAHYTRCIKANLDDLNTENILFRHESEMRIVHPKLIRIVDNVPEILLLLKTTTTDVSMASQCCLLIAEHAVDAQDRKNIVFKLKGYEIIVNIIQFQIKKVTLFYK